jgi:hypothetical protein
MGFCDFKVRSKVGSGAYLLRGRIYNRTKKQAGGTGANQHTEQTGQNGQSATATKLAADYGVDERTIRRDGQFARAVETVKAADPSPPAPAFPPMEGETWRY